MIVLIQIKMLSMHCCKLIIYIQKNTESNNKILISQPGIMSTVTIMPHWGSAKKYISNIIQITIKTYNSFKDNFTSEI
jgi:hypothetical protein